RPVSPSDRKERVSCVGASPPAKSGSQTESGDCVLPWAHYIAEQVNRSMDRMPLGSPTRFDIAAWILTGFALLLVLQLHLLPALLAGLLVFELVHIMAPRLRIWRMGHEWSKVLAVTVLTVLVVLLVTLVILGVIALLRTDVGSVSALLRQMAE